MKKFAILLVIFVSSLFTSHLYAQSCTTQFSGTTFQPKTGVTSANYNLEQIRLEDPSSEVVTTGLTFKNSNTLDRGEYTVSQNKATFRITQGNSGVFMYSLSDLLVNNTYKITIRITARKIANCTATNNEHRVKLVLKNGKSVCKI